MLCDLLYPFKTNVIDYDNDDYNRNINDDDNIDDDVKKL